MIQENNIPWCEKHRASCFADVRGQDFAIDKVKEFLRGFPRKKSIVLHGPPGTGKTSLAYAIAFENDAEILELNASDLRNKAKIAEIVGPASRQKSLFRQNKVILVDEVDGISTSDRGGLPELLKLIDDSAFPVIITANDIWNKKFSELRKKVDVVQMKDIDYKIILDVLKSVCSKENCSVAPDVLTSISIKSRGDLRAALNDLQIVASTGDSSLVSDLGERNKEVSIFNALKIIFKEKATNDSLKIFDSVKMPIDEIILWIEENIPAEYNGEELARAYDLLSKVDIFKRRIYRQQYWRFLVYENAFLSYGISASKKQIKTGFTTYKRPTRILKMWLNNQRTMKMKSIADKYAKMVHVGQKRAKSEFPIIKQIINSNPKISKELKLDEEEIMYLKN